MQTENAARLTDTLITGGLPCVEITFRTTAALDAVRILAQREDILIKSAQTCRYDLVPLGEVMLRLDAGNERIHRTRNFRVWQGGGEYNAEGSANVSE
jgi:hypothetical protein